MKKKQPRTGKAVDYHKKMWQSNKRACQVRPHFHKQVGQRWFKGRGLSLHGL